MKCVLASVVVAWMIGRGGVARADDSSYRVAIGAVDGVAGGLVAGSIAIGEGALPLAVAGALACVVAPPIVHAAHGNFGRAGISLAAHVALPLIGIGLGVQGDTLDSAVLGGVAGALIGHVAASIIDVALAYRDTPSDPLTPRLISVGGSF